MKISYWNRWNTFSSVWYILSIETKTKGLFTWRKVVPGRRVTLQPEPSFTKRLYEKSCPCWPSQNLALSGTHALVGEAQTAKVFIWKQIWLALQGHPTFKASDPPPWVTLPPSQLFDFSCKRLTAIYKEMNEKFSRPEWLGMEGNHNLSPCK